tara:strand:- start:3816 stop:4052 length:237 start_codon:yes stop_codon:yes gene_type:complete
MIFTCKQCGEQIGSVAKIIDLNILHIECVEKYNQYVELERLARIQKWESLGFLEGLKGHVKENIAQLYEGQASRLLSE